MGELTVAQQGIGRFLAVKFHVLAKKQAELLSDATNTEQFRTGKIDDEGRASNVLEGPQSHCVGIGLPQSVEMTHRQVDWLSGLHALGKVHEDAVSQFRGVVETKNGRRNAKRAAVMLKYAFAADTALGVFADRAQRVGLRRAAEHNGG